MREQLELVRVRVVCGRLRFLLETVGVGSESELSMLRFKIILEAVRSYWLEKFLFWTRIVNG